MFMWLLSLPLQHRVLLSPGKSNHSVFRLIIIINKSEYEYTTKPSYGHLLRNLWHFSLKGHTQVYNHKKIGDFIMA